MKFPGWNKIKIRKHFLKIIKVAKKKTYMGLTETNVKGKSEKVSNSFFVEKLIDLLIDLFCWFGRKDLQRLDLK